MSLRTLVGGWEAKHGRSLEVRRFANFLLELSGGMTEEEIAELATYNLCDLANKPGNQTIIRKYIQAFPETDVNQPCRISLDDENPGMLNLLSTPLGVAVYRQHTNNVGQLLQLKADPNVMVGDHAHAPTPVLRWATNSNMTSIVQLLLRAKADPNVGQRIRNEQLTVLGTAAQRSHTKPAMALLQAKADPNMLHGRNSPLHYAAHGNSPMTRSLLEAKADPSIRGRRGYPPIMEADGASLRLLLNAKANPNATNRFSAPLIEAMGKDKPEEIQMLLDANADPHLKVHGHSVLDIARAHYPEYVAMLEGNIQDAQIQDAGIQDAEPAEKRKRK